VSEIEQSVEDLIKANEDQYNAARSGKVIEEVEETLEEPKEEAEEEVEETAEDPPGYLGYEDWIAAGKDPDLFKGKKAYEAEYDRLQETKQLRDELKGMKLTTQQIADSMSEWQQKQQDQIKAELQAKLAQATEDDDVNAALQAQKEIDSLKPVQKPVGEPPAIQQFRQDNPILLSSSPEFNLQFDKTVERLFNAEVNRQAWGQVVGGKVVDYDQEDIKTVLNYAMREAKQLYPDLFKSPKNARATLSAPKKTGPGKPDPMNQLKGHIIDSKNPRNRTAALDMAEFLKEKYGDAFDAEQFANNVVK